MIDWLTILIALIIIISLIGGFGYLAWKINMSDPLVSNDIDSINDKKRKEKNLTEQSKKKQRKEQKKSKRENKNDEEKSSLQRNKPLQTSEETDDEQEESEQDLLIVQTQNVETSSKARKRNNKNKTRTATPPPPPPTTTKNPITTRAPPATHPKSTPKDEHELTKQKTLPPPPPTTANTKKPTQNVQKQREQPFTVVGNNRNKSTTSTVQQNKSQVNTTLSVIPPVQHEQLAPRQSLPQKETSVPVTVSTTNPLPVVKQTPKIADLIKVLPSSQVVVTELMAALDAFPLSTDELDIIMHKIANKQSVVKQDWNKLQQGQKVDPQAHIGQVLDESAKAYEDDMKNNSMKRIKDLTNELNTEKRRNNELLKDKSDKEREIQILHAQLDSVQHKTESSNIIHPQQKLQTVELQLKRITEENLLLSHQLAQQQQLTASNLTNTNDTTNMKVQVLSEQIKKLSVDNANLEKKSHSNELLAKEAQNEKEDLIRYNEQLTQSLETTEKELKYVEEKHHKQLNETRTLHLNEINEYKKHIQQLENDNEQLKREEIIHIEPSTTTDIQTLTVNNEEREQFENEIQQFKQTIQTYQSKENELKQEIERIKHDKNHEQQQIDESRNNELNTLRTELNKVKSILSQSEEHLRQEHEKQRQILSDLLSQDLRNQLPNNNQDFNQWLLSYHQLSESNKRNLLDESEKLKRENAEIHKNMTDIEKQLKDIEKTVQNKEGILLEELKSKDVIVDNLRNENHQLTNELQHLHHEIQNLQSIHNASVSEAHALKLQLNERFLAATNSPSIVAADESFELLKQPSPSLSPIVVDIRAEQLNELIRSSKEALENQDTVTQQLDIHHSGLGETDDSTVSSSSDQQT